MNLSAIRPLTVAEAAHAAALIRAAFAAIDPPLDPPPSALRVQTDTIRAHLEHGGGALHGAVGCILWHVRDGGLYVSRLAVMPEARGQGVAAALLRHAETVARARALPRLHLEVRLALDGNRRLFRRLGFVEGAQHTHPGYDRPTYLSAEKRL